MKLLYFKTPLARLLLLVLIILQWTISDCSTTTSSNVTLSTSMPPPTQQTTSNTKPRPENVQNVEVIDQRETNITLKWEKVNNISTYTLCYDHNGSLEVENVNSSTGASITHVIGGLTAGTKYNFTIITQLEGATSTGYSVEAVTKPLNPAEFGTVTQTESSITLRWRKVNGNSSYILVYDGEHVDVPASEGADVVQVISNLTSMTRYSFTLFAVFANNNSSGVEHTAYTAPPNVRDVQIDGQNEISITLRWRKIPGNSSYILVYDETSHNIPASAGDEVIKVVSNLTSMTRYNFTLFAVFENISSSAVKFSAATAPRNPSWFKSVSQSETTITLQWERVDGILEYTLFYSQEHISVSDFASQEVGTHTLIGLTSGAKYNISLFAVFEDIQSSGTEHTAATVPPMVTGVTVTERKTTSVTLMWNVDIQKEWTYFLYFQGKNVTFQANDFFSQELSGLQPGTEYTFSLVTHFFGLNSKAYEGFAVTKIDCSGVNWHVTDSSIRGEVEGLFTEAIATSKSQVQVSTGGSNVSFTGLYPGDTYEISLLYEKNRNNFSQCSLNLTIIPPALSGHCEHWAAGYSLKIVWNKPPGVWTAVEVNVSGRTLRTGNQEEQHLTASGFQPAATYQVSLTALSGTVRRSEPSVFLCHTDPRGVIAGSAVAVLLVGVLICIAVFIYYRRPKIRLFSGGTKQPDKKPKAISAAKFSGHVHRLSDNDHMGFSEEYENLDPVGREQTQKAALLPENKPKNRFVNILPYDWCRVKLSKSSPDASDYINASYMPGYSSNREYIATQGPLPSTLNDFWQMVWEQGVKGIVMVTNCSEKGRVKCERYWPAVSKPCQYGELLVTTESEQEESSWTLRKLTLKNSQTSEEYRVKQFHFTAWPDHGVPLNTQVLIHFRELVRQHIQREGGSAPTVVHCSAGVGRTGTIIALDVLLQQLQNEKAVGLYAFVHRMRLHRSNMVQTESQYVFLHQCVMDSLQKDRTEESIYGNSDIIYANATALKELSSHA